MANSKTILLAVGVIAVAGIAYFALDGGVTSEDAVQGTIAPGDQHQNNKSAYYDQVNQTTEVANMNALAKIAVAMERAPAQAEMLLQEQGWSQADYEQMVEKVSQDENLERLFRTAKRNAYGQ